jgi:hypothetical protein
LVSFVGWRTGAIKAVGDQKITAEARRREFGAVAFAW